MDKAAERITQSIIFRADCKIDELAKAELPEHFMKHDFIPGVDTDGRPPRHAVRLWHWGPCRPLHAAPGRVCGSGGSTWSFVPSGARVAPERSRSAKRTCARRLRRRRFAEQHVAGFFAPCCGYRAGASLRRRVAALRHSLGHRSGRRPEHLLEDPDRD